MVKEHLFFFVLDATHINDRVSCISFCNSDISQLKYFQKVSEALYGGSPHDRSCTLKRHITETGLQKHSQTDLCVSNIAKQHRHLWNL